MRVRTAAAICKRPVEMHRTGLPLRGAGARSATERCDRSAMCEKLVEIAAAPTPLRQAYGLPPPLKGRLWVDQEIDPYKSPLHLLLPQGLFMVCTQYLVFIPIIDNNFLWFSPRFARLFPGNRIYCTQGRGRGGLARNIVFLLGRRDHAKENQPNSHGVRPGEVCAAGKAAPQPLSAPAGL